MAKPELAAHPQDLAAKLNETNLYHFSPCAVDVVEVSIAATGFLTAHLARIRDEHRRRAVTSCLVNIILDEQSVDVGRTSRRKRCSGTSAVALR